jgi:hypothetical protein
MNSFDCSSEKGFRIFLPGAWLVKEMKLQWKGREGQFFDPQDRLVAFDPAVLQKGPHALLARKQILLSTREKAGYEVIWFLLGGKDSIGGHPDYGDWPGEIQISGVYWVKEGRISGRLRPKIIRPRGAQKIGRAAHPKHSVVPRP